VLSISETKVISGGAARPQFQSITAADMFKDFDRQKKELLNSQQKRQQGDVPTDRQGASREIPALPRLGRGLSGAQGLVNLDDVAPVRNTVCDAAQLAKVTLSVSCTELE